MGQSLRDSTQKERKVGRVTLCGLMEVHTKVIFMTIIFMGEVFISGQMEEFMMGHGRTIKCMEMDYLHGQMEEGMMVST